MVEKDKQYVLQQAKENDVKFIRLWFTDILGMLKSFAITVDELETAMEDGMGFDGSSIEGYARIDESDMMAVPDPSTFCILPWRPKEHNAVGRMFCDIQRPEGDPYESDPRFILKKNLARAADLGYNFYVGPELEYFYFKNSTSTEVLDHGGYFDLTPLDAAFDLRRDTVLALESMGIGVEYSHHEVAPSQHEIDMRYTDALTMADNAMTFRLVVKEVAMNYGCHATFMPKPLANENGSGMHVHMSLFKGDRNAFFDPSDPNHLSDTAKMFIAGLLKHAPEICIVCSQWVNSYKRLVPGYEAPVYLTWAVRNRSDLIRVPGYKPGKEKATRLEFRSPDPACNPYLAFSALLAAGLEGIEKQYELRPATTSNVYKMTEAERKEQGIGMLPEDLWEAVQIAEESELLKRCMGEHTFDKFIENKKMEWDRYRSIVTPWELENYLPIL